METVHPFKMLRHEFVSIRDDLVNVVNLGLNALDGDRDFYYIDSEGKAEIREGTLAWTDENEIIRMPLYGVWVGRARPEGIGVLRIKCLLSGVQSSRDNVPKIITRRHDILVKVTENWGGNIKGFIEAQVILQPAVDVILAALSSAAGFPGKTSASTSENLKSDDQAGEPSAVDEETRKRLAAVRGWLAARESGVKRRDYVAPLGISESGLTRWRDELREQGFDVPDF